ncbi:MAG: hypothetical protein RJA70_4514 [Pseudomonadota bacterium]
MRVACKPGSVVTLQRVTAFIHLGCRLLCSSSNLPEGSDEPSSSAFLSGLAPSGVCQAEDVTIFAVGSYPTVSPLPGQDRSPPGGLFSVALSSRSPSPGVTRHSALRSPDFPPALLAERQRTPLLPPGYLAFAVTCVPKITHECCDARGLGRLRSVYFRRQPIRFGVFRHIKQLTAQLGLSARFQLPGALSRDAKTPPNLCE